MPILETDEVKESNGARTVEVAVQTAGVPFTFIRPQYIYGPRTAKRYLDYFVGRAARKLPIPLPLSGQQFSRSSHHITTYFLCAD
jgi:UDP-glucose 4-epimerase